MLLLRRFLKQQQQKKNTVKSLFNLIFHYCQGPNFILDSFSKAAFTAQCLTHFPYETSHRFYNRHQEKRISVQLPTQIQLVAFWNVPGFSDMHAGPRSSWRYFHISVSNNFPSLAISHEIIQRYRLPPPQNQLKAGFIQT